MSVRGSLVLTLILVASALAGSPGGQGGTPVGSWILTKQTDGVVGYVWGYKDTNGFVHRLTLAESKARNEAIDYGVERRNFQEIPLGGEWFGGNAPRPHPLRVGATGEKPRRIHLTVIGPKAARETVLADLEKDPAFNALAIELGDTLAVQSYDPADPMIADIKISDGGNPDVVIQDETGRVRFRAHDYPGPARTVAEIRRADPKYDPKKDPDGEKKLPLDALMDGLPPIDERTAIMIVVLILGVAYLLKQRQS